MKRCAHAMLFGLGVCGLLACASVQRKPSSTLETLFGAADLQRVRALAPDFLERATAARRRARDEARVEPRADDEREAALLLRAAIAEADRIESDRKAAVAERRYASAVAALALANSARRAAENELTRVAAEQTAEGAAPAAFAKVLAASACEPSGSPQCRQLRQPAAAFLVRRARLTWAAAEALGADAAALDQAGSKLFAAEVTLTRGATDLVSAQAALEASLSALGSARARVQESTGEQVRDLLARAHELGLPVAVGPHGVVVTLSDLFAARSSQMRRAALPRLALLRALLSAYPYGEIRIDAHALGRSLVMSQRVASRRAAAVRAFLAETLQGDRVVTEAAAQSAVADDEHTTLLLRGYTASGAS